MLEEVSDKELCDRAHDGDREALGEILRRHSGRLYRMLLARLGSPSSAEEALAAAYIEVLESFHRFKWTESGVYPWLHVVTLRVAYHAIRKSKRETLCAPSDLLAEIDRVAPAPARQNSDADVAYEYRETQHYVERALRRMRPADAEVIRLSVLEGRGRQDCADTLGIKLGTFDVRLHRALARLREELRALWDEGSEALVIAVLEDTGGDVRHYMFNRFEIDIGRGVDNELVLANDDVSRAHARLVSKDGNFIVEDLDSTNGTFVNGARVDGKQRCGEADELRVGPFRLRVHRVADEEERVAISSAANSVFVSRAAAATVFSGGERSPESFAVKPTHALSQHPEEVQDQLGQIEELLSSRRSIDGHDGVDRGLKAAWGDSTHDLDEEFHSRLVDTLNLHKEDSESGGGGGD